MNLISLQKAHEIFSSIRDISGDVLAIIEQVKLQFRRRHPVESHLCVAEAKWVIEMVVSLFNIPVKVR